MPRQIVKRNVYGGETNSLMLGANQFNQRTVNLNGPRTFNQEPRDNFFASGFDLAHNSYQKVHHHVRVPFVPPTAYSFVPDPFANQQLPNFMLQKPYRSSSVSSQGSVDKRELPIPPKNNHMYHETRYKTELCRQFEEYGNCEYADRCLFAHGTHELKEMKNRHPKYKSELCSSFDELGLCQFGKRCSFRHQQPEFNVLYNELMKPIPCDMKWPDLDPVQREKDMMNQMFDMCMPYVSDEARLPVFIKMCARHF